MTLYVHVVIFDQQVPVHLAQFLYRKLGMRLLIEVVLQIALNLILVLDHFKESQVILIELLLRDFGNIIVARFK